MIEKSRMARKSLYGKAGLVLALLAISALCVGAERRGGGKRDDWQRADQVIRDMGIKPGDSVADVGCGSGYFSFKMADFVGKDGKIFALDIAEKSVARVKDKIGKEKRSNMKAIVSEPTDAKLAAESVDAILMCNVLHHVGKDQRMALLKNIAGSIKPGGSFTLLDWSETKKRPMAAHDKPIPREKLVEMFKEVGLEVEAEFFYLKYQISLRFRKAAK